MKVGIIVPQGWTGEYDGWDAARAWSRSLEIAQEAERLGAESLWVYDHVHTTPEPTDELTFESFTVLAALASVTRQVRLGHTVVCAGYRNPALLAKIASTLDVISGGRFDLGLGAGWKEEEYLAYGWPFPSLKARQELLRDTLEIVRRMTDPDGGRASYEGAQASIHDAINLPKPIGPGGLPIMVGGNGRRVTWGLAARYADELNLDAVAPGRLPDALATIRQRCEEVGRDPATLRVSVHLWLRDGAWLHDTGEDELSHQELLQRYAELGIHRVMGLVPGCTTDSDALPRFFESARDAGAELASVGAADGPTEPGLETAPGPGETAGPGLADPDRMPSETSPLR